MGKELLTYQIFNMVKDIFADNLSLREKINEYIRAFLKQTEHKIEEHYQAFNQEAI